MVLRGVLAIFLAMSLACTEGSGNSSEGSSGGDGSGDDGSFAGGSNSTVVTGTNLAQVEPKCISTEDSTTKKSTLTCRLYFTDGTSLAQQEVSGAEGVAINWSFQRKFGELADANFSESGKNDIVYVAEFNETNNAVRSNVNVEIVDLIDATNSLLRSEAFEFENFCSDVTGQTNYAEKGDGSRSNPYIICSSAALASFANMGCNGTITTDCDKSLRIGVDIEGVDFQKTIGHPTQGYHFTGYFEGNGRRFHNFSYTSGADVGQELGIFSYVGAGAIIEHMYVDNVSISTKAGLGIVVYEAADGAILRNIHVKDVTITNSSAGVLVGGIVGYLSNAQILNSSANINLQIQAGYIGGITGYASGTSLISESYATGSIVASSGGWIGGLAGQLSGAIEDSYAQVSITNTVYTGGIAGYCFPAAQIDRVYAAGALSGSKVGGIVGDGNCTNVTRSHYDSDLMGAIPWSGATSPASVDATPHSTAEMFSQSTYAEWDFNAVWGINPNQYPYLQSIQVGN